MKILFFVFYFLTTFGLNAQIDIPLEKSYKIKKMQKYIKVKSEMFHFRVYGETWFSTIDDLVDIAEIPSTSDDNPLYITPIFQIRRFYYMISLLMKFTIIGYMVWLKS